MTGHARSRAQHAGVREHYDGRAATYDDSPMHRGVAAEVAGLVEAEAPAGGVVLDVATGTALVLRSIARRDLRLVGIDLSAAMLAVGASAAPHCALALGDAERLPVPGGSIDVMTCVTALHLLPDIGAALREWRRVMRDDGLLVTASFAPTGLPAAADSFTRRHDLVDSSAKVGTLAAAAGFDLIEAHESDHGDDRLVICRLRP